MSSHGLSTTVLWNIAWQPKRFACPGQSLDCILYRPNALTVHHIIYIYTALYFKVPLTMFLIITWQTKGVFPVSCILYRPNALFLAVRTLGLFFCMEHYPCSGIDPFYVIQNHPKEPIISSYSILWHLAVFDLYPVPILLFYCHLISNWYKDT